MNCEASVIGQASYPQEDRELISDSLSNTPYILRADKIQQGGNKKMARQKQYTANSKPIYFRPDQVELIKKLADEQKVSDSEIVRNAIDGFYGKHNNEKK